MFPLRQSERQRRIVYMLSLFAALLACACGESDVQTPSSTGPDGTAASWPYPPLVASELVNYACKSIGRYHVVGVDQGTYENGLSRTTFHLSLQEAWLSGSANEVSWAIPCGASSPCATRLAEGREYAIFWYQIEPPVGEDGFSDLLAAFQEYDNAVYESLELETGYSSLDDLRVATQEALAEAQIFSVLDCEQVSYFQASD